jgi:hypothetical protein
MTTISADQASLRGTASCAEARIVGAGIPVLNLAIFLGVIGGFVAMGIIRFSRRKLLRWSDMRCFLLAGRGHRVAASFGDATVDSHYEFVGKRHGAMLLKQVIDVAGKKG